MLELIKETFMLNGFEFKLLERKGDIVLYELNKTLWKGTKDEVSWREYEVHKVRVKLIPIQWQNKEFTHRERLAGESAFGRYGWSFLELKRAKQKMLNIINLEAEREVESNLRRKKYDTTEPRIP